MSIDFVPREPMTLDDAVSNLLADGCTVMESCDGEVVVRDPDGNFLHLIEFPGSYTTVIIDHATGEITGYRDPDRVIAQCYGRNNPDRMVFILDMVPESEDEFFELIGSDLSAAVEVMSGCVPGNDD
jgi:hypothetical protein